MPTGPLRGCLLALVLVAGSLAGSGTGAGVASPVAPAAARASAYPPAANGLIAYTKGLDHNANGFFDGGSAEELTTDVYLQPAVPGATPTLLHSPNRAADISPSFSPDGTAVVWASTVGGSFDIWWKDLRTQRTRNLTGGTGDLGNERWPVFSPDGRHIVFLQQSGRANLDVWLMAADGTDRRYVAGSKGPGRFAEDCCASFTPDGRHIVFASNRDGDFDLYRYLPAEGATRELPRRLVRLTDRPRYQGTPSVERSGTVLFRDGRDQRMYRMDPFGARDAAELVPVRGHVRTPEGSPDGRYVIFGSRAHRGAQLDIAVADADGGTMRLLTDDPSYSETEPTWQPLPL